MFRVIARYAPAVVAFGVLTTGSLSLNAYGAEVAAELPSVTVRYTDLNLNTSNGVEALYSRLRAAARTVCDVREQRPLAEAVKANACYRQVLGAAMGSVKLLTSNAGQRADATGDDLS
jgi:UrcA family protein